MLNVDGWNVPLVERDALACRTVVVSRINKEIERHIRAVNMNIGGEALIAAAISPLKRKSRGSTNGRHKQVR